MVLFQSYVFVWSISSEVFCRWSSFQAMFLCGALAQRCSVDEAPFKLCTQRHNLEGRPSTEHIWANAQHKNIILKEDYLQNIPGRMHHTKT
jgi:hypothetical protein